MLVKGAWSVGGWGNGRGNTADIIAERSFIEAFIHSTALKQIAQ